jgi:F-type H+-transporting ATPase subunit c
MKKLLANVAVVFGSLMMSSLAFAQGDAGGSSQLGLIAIGVGITMGLAAFGAATGQGRTAASALEGIARNPNAKDAMFLSFILGLVFMEFQALLGFVIAIIWTNKF